MEHSIKRVAVLGAGTMGAGIAAHVANAGLPVLVGASRKSFIGATLGIPDPEARLAGSLAAAAAA